MISSVFLENNTEYLKTILGLIFFIRQLDDCACLFAQRSSFMSLLKTCVKEKQRAFRHHNFMIHNVVKDMKDKDKKVLFYVIVELNFTSGYISMSHIVACKTNFSADCSQNILTLIQQIY